MARDNEAFWFLVSGTIGTVLFNIFYSTLYTFMIFDWYKASTCWVISYICSIIWQHKLHHVIVFPDRKIKDYGASLIKTFITYSVSLVLSTIIMAVMETMNFNHMISWCVALLSTGIINFILVRDYAMK